MQVSDKASLRDIAVLRASQILYRTQRVPLA